MSKKDNKKILTLRFLEYEINKGTEKSFAELLADNLNKVNDD